LRLCLQTSRGRISRSWAMGEGELVELQGYREAQRIWSLGSGRVLITVVSKKAGQSEKRDSRAPFQCMHWAAFHEHAQTRTNAIAVENGEREQASRGRGEGRGKKKRNRKFAKLWRERTYARTVADSCSEPRELKDIVVRKELQWGLAAQ
jgi:hypothetical protein